MENIIKEVYRQIPIILIIFILGILCILIIKDNHKEIIKIVRNFYSGTWSIFVIILFLIIIGAIFWQISPSTKDFGLNFFTEMLGVLVTVLIIDKINQIRKNNHLLPKRIAAYEDITLYVSRYVHFWVSIYRESVPYNDPKDLKEFFSKAAFQKIMRYLHMDSVPEILPPQKWWDYLPYMGEEFKANGDKILNRHINVIEPEVYANIHRLIEGNLINSLIMIPSALQVDTTYKHPRVKILGEYSIQPDDEDLSPIIYLYEWCEKQHSLFKKNNISVREVLKYTPMENKKMPPKSQIPDKIFTIQTKEWEAFKNVGIQS